MRQKDADEVARILGNEQRHADTMEKEGIEVAHLALLGHYKHRYPDNISAVQVHDNYRKARDEPPTGV
jgi:hypothetical protein